MSGASRPSAKQPGVTESAALQAAQTPPPADPEDRLSKVTRHVRTETEHGPDYCHPCSDAIGDWVPWPCPGSLAAQTPPSVRPR